MRVRDGRHRTKQAPPHVSLANIANFSGRGLDHLAWLALAQHTPVVASLRLRNDLPRRGANTLTVQVVYANLRNGLHQSLARERRSTVISRRMHVKARGTSSPSPT